ncbi:hypothetical protein FKM82_026446 [Ascaphus truei]
MAKANNKGDSGYPCLVPFHIGKGSDEELFVFTMAVGTEYSVFMLFKMLGVNPICESVAFINCQSSLSKRFFCV